MLGLINDCAEQLVITKFGIDAWHAIKESAGCSVKDNGFEQHGHYPDSATVDIVVAAAEALSVTVDDVLELFGQYFLEYTIDKGYDNLLRCQGSTLRLWLSNLNAMHDHLQSSLPAGNFPVFWCEDCVTHDGSIILHYYSVRGPLLASVVVGIVKEVANTYFDVEVKMDKIATQGEEESECTTWRISAVDPEKKHKLTMQNPADAESIIVQQTIERRATLKHNNRRRSTQDSMSELGASAGDSISELQCPFASVHTSVPSIPNGSFHGIASLNSSSSGNEHKSEESEETEKLRQEKLLQRRASSENLMRRNSTGGKSPRASTSGVSKSAPSTVAPHNVVPEEYEYGLPSAKVRSVFPYHVMVDTNFTILQVGRALPEMLMRDYEDLIGLPVDKVLKITKPILAGFDWPILQRLADQKFFLTPVAFDDEKTGARIETSDIKFKGNMITIAKEGKAMFVLSPDAENIVELTQMGLTMSDLPLHSFQRDVVFLGEHIASEVRTAHKLDKLSKRLEREKNLSNTLLNSMLPASVAESMRAGKTVEPLLYENVTLFFSDVVGFTSICDAVEPWDVIDMLNQLYTVMDHLASHFNLYKVETIGDAYMCCSGMPTPDENHAQNIANFALAVSECVHLVQSPADGSPLQLRIGIHTGHCMGGVVGTLTPHYCLFGDMVNTTARHESTGLNGKIQCSSVLYEHLAEYSADSKGPLYTFTPRGYVDMKGKGRCYTYWLDKGSDYNEFASPEKINKLREEVKKTLSKKRWKKRKYFNFGRRRSSTIFGHGMDDMTTVDGSTYQDEASIATASQTEGMASSIAEEMSGMLPTGSRRSVVSSVEGESGLSSGMADGFDDSDHDTVSFVELKKTAWSDIKWDPGLSRVDLVAAIHGLLSSMLWKCAADVTEKMPDNKEVLDHELLRFVDRISSLYEAHPFHSWDHACQVVLSAAFLVKEYHLTKDDVGGPIDGNPFVRFITVFSALIHDVKHLGLPNAQLEKDKHCLSIVYQGSFLERQSIQVGLGIFIEDFPELSTLILKMCPEFLHLVTSAVLATDVASGDIQEKIQDRFEQVVIVAGDAVTEFEKTQAVVEQMLLLADVGHCSQGYDNFLTWNLCFFHECLKNYKDGNGADPRPGWFEGQIGFLEGYILPLTERCNALIPQCELTKGTRRIIRMWKKDGQEWTTNLIEQSMKAEKSDRKQVKQTINKGVGAKEANAKVNSGVNSEITPSTTTEKRPGGLRKRLSVFSRKSASKNKSGEKSTKSHHKAVSSAARANGEQASLFYDDNFADDW